MFIRDRQPLSLALILWLSIILLLSGCSSLLYYPSRQMFVDLTKLEKQPEPRELMLGELKVHGWYFRANPQPSKGVIVYFHGNGQNRSAHFYALYWLVKRGYDLVIYDYPGYGQTTGKPSPKSTVAMAMAALRSVQAETKLPIIVYGQSLGGAVAMRALWELRDEFRPDLLVVDSSFLSYQKAARKIVARSAWTWALQPIVWLVIWDTWAPGDRLKDLAGTPVLVLHSTRDEIVPYSLGEEVFASAGEPKEFWKRTESRHNSAFENPEGVRLRDRLVSAFDEIVRNNRSQ